MQQSSDGFNFQRGMGVLRRRGLWILLCFVLAAAAAYGLSKHQTKTYTATASLVFNGNQLTQQIAGLPIGISVQAAQNSDLKLVRVGDMAEKTASKLGRELTEQKVGESLSIAQQGETSIVGESSIVDVSASSTSPTLAAAIANTYTEQFVAEQRAANHQYFKSALATVSKQLAALSPKQRLSTAGAALQGRAQEVKLLAELQYGGVKLAQSAPVPTSPSSPRTSRNTLIGGVMGLLVGLGLALLLERLDLRIREPEDLEAIYRSPLLGIVAESQSLSRSVRHSSQTPLVLPPAEAEAFNLILAHLRSFNAEHDPRTVLVTSAAQGDGTTTITLHLAEAAARGGSRTLLLEMDLRHPTLASHLCIQSGPGLRDMLTDTIMIGEAVQSIDLPAPAGAKTEGPVPLLDILTAGTAQSSSPGELIKSSTMDAVLEQTKSTYDLVVIDTPPLTAVSDAFPILRKVDGVIVVSRIGHDRRDTAEQLRQVLDRSAAPLLGVIANRSKSKGRRPYTYDYVADDEPASTAASTSSVPRVTQA